MQIQWYPGHMTKTRRMLEKTVSQADAICEILDARIPAASHNPDIDRLPGNLPRLLVLNRADQADPGRTVLWRRHFEALGMAVLETDSKSGTGVRGFEAAARRLLSEKLDRYAQKGQVGRALRLLVVGIPNVGKSSFINRVMGRRAAKAEDRPGVTRSGQWFAAAEGIELFDTPGMLWPKIENMQTGLLLAFTGAVRDDILQLEELGAHLMQTLGQAAPRALRERYGVDAETARDGHAALTAAARRRGFLLPGGEVDLERMARILLDEFRGGKLGRVTLEPPPEAAKPDA